MKILNLLYNLFQKDPPKLKPFDPMENLCNGDNVTKWKHIRLCPNCLNETTHQERMTEICLSCGKGGRLLSSDGVVREIVYKGKWCENLRFNGKHYLDKVEYQPEMKKEEL